MTALPARVQFIQTEFRRAVVEDSDVRSRHGALARETDDPVETFFDNVADAAVMAQDRLDLLGPERRRFNVKVIGVDEALALGFTGGQTPTGIFIDSERDVDRPVVLGSITIDLARQQAEFGIWG